MVSYDQPRQYEPAEGSRSDIDEALRHKGIEPRVDEPKQNVGELERLISAAVGFKLLSFALRRLGIAGLLACGVSVALFSRAYSGHCVVKERLALKERLGF